MSVMPFGNWDIRDAAIGRGDIHHHVSSLVVCSSSTVEACSDRSLWTIYLSVAPLTKRCDFFKLFNTRTNMAKVKLDSQDETSPPVARSHLKSARLVGIPVRIPSFPIRRKNWNTLAKPLKQRRIDRMAFLFFPFSLIWLDLGKKDKFWQMFIMSVYLSSSRRMGLALGLLPCSVTNGLNLLKRCETIVWSWYGIWSTKIR